jgi:hypothetical protein
MLGPEPAGAAIAAFTALAALVRARRHASRDAAR